MLEATGRPAKTLIESGIEPEKIVFLALSCRIRFGTSYPIYSPGWR